MQAPRRLQLRRGNTAAVSTYLGAAGELIINTDTNTLYVHNGVTVGGIATTVNVSTITNQITAANVGMQGYVDFSIQSNIANIAAGYTNTNVKSYLSSFDGNIIPGGNVAYTLGNITHQWKDLFVSNNTIYVGGVPLSIDATGNLTINGNTIPTVAYVNTQIANVQVDLTSYALNANVAAANVGMQGYVNQANSIQSAQITAANIGLKGYVDSQISNLIGGAPGILDTLGEIAASINDDANVYASLVSSIASSNVGLKGYVDQANTIQNGQLTQANLGMKGYVDNAVSTIVIPVTYSNINVQAYTETMGFTNYSNVNVAAYITTQGITSYSNVNVDVYTNLGTYAYSANVTAANIGMKGYVDSLTYSNIQTAAYLTTNNYLTSATANLSLYAWNGNASGGGTSYSNVNVAAYLSTATINTSGNITAQYISGNISITGNVTGTSPNVTLQAGAHTSVFDNQGNVRLPTAYVAGNVTANYFVGNGALLTGIVSGGGTNYSNSNVIAYLGVVANHINPVPGDIWGLGAENKEWYSAHIKNAYIKETIQAYSGGGYSGGNAGELLKSTGSGIAWQEIKTVNGNSLFGNGDITISGGGSTYGDSNVASYLPTYTGVVTASNVAVAGNVTAQYLFGNGSQLTGLPATYSNVQVATYLPTYTGNIANVRLSSSGVLTFPDGTQQTTAAFGGGSNYGNANVAAYLPTYTGTTGITQVGTLATLNVTGNTTVGNLVGTEANTRIIANTYVSTFDIYGNVTFPGNVIATYFVGDGSRLTGIVSGGGSSYGNANVAQYLPTYSGNIANVRLGVSGVLTFADGTTQTTAGGGSYSNVQVATYLPTYSGNIVAANVWTTGNATGSGALTVGPAGYTALPTTITQFTGNANTYTQLNIQNISTGTDATAEYVATANNGTDTTFFVDLGIANRNYDVNSPANSLGTTIYPNDSFLYAQGNLATTTGGNLAIGTSTPNKSVKIFAGGINSANIVATVSNTGVAVTGSISATANVSATNMTASGNITASGYIVTTGGYGNISQVDYITANNVVATANVTVQGMGVTMPNRPALRVNGSTQNIPQTLTANVNLKGDAVVVAYNQGNYYNNTTGQFIAPVAGIYSVGLNARVGTNNALNQIAVLKNGLNTTGNVVCFWETDTNAGTAMHFGVNGTVILAVGDYLSANILAGNITFDNNDNWHVTYLG